MRGVAKVSWGEELLRALPIATSVSWVPGSNLGPAAPWTDSSLRNSNINKCRDPPYVVQNMQRIPCRAELRLWQQGVGDEGRTATVNRNVALRFVATGMATITEV